MGTDTYDVIVVGLGAWGSSALFHVAAHGHRVLGLDQYPVPHEHGTSHGRSRGAIPAGSRENFSANLTRRSFELYAELSAECGTQLLTRTGMLWIATEGSDLLRGALAGYEAYGTPYSLLDAAAVASRFPAFRLSPGQVGVHEEGTSMLVPGTCISAHVDGAVRRGADVRFERMQSWTADADGVRVVTNDGTYRAAKLVLAVGWWAVDVLGIEGLPVNNERQVTCTLPIPPSARPVPVFLVECDPPAQFFYGVPEGASQVKTAFHHGGLEGHPLSLPREVFAADIEAILGMVDRCVPGLVRDVLDSTTCIYTNSNDATFIISPHPDSPNVFVATGETGSGFQAAPAVGELLANLVDGNVPDGAQSLWLERFDTE